MTSDTTNIALITCSYAPDRTRCERLCRSIDRWAAASMRHTIVVPSRDLPLFAALAGGRRYVVAAEDVLPASYRQLPFSDRWWLSPRGRPVRGWIMQQLTKLCADRVTGAENILFADSDLVFLRPLTAGAFLREGRLRLHRIPGAKNTGRHRNWHRRAARLLGESPRYFGSDYIGQMITWRRSHLIAMKRHIEGVHARPWHEPVSASLELSEYILYGAYIDAIVGPEASGHYPCASDPCHCCWFAEDVHALEGGGQALRPDALALLLQSNLGLSDARERALISRITRNHARGLEAC